MKRLLFVAAIGLIAAPVLAGSGLFPVTGVKYAAYDAATGVLTPTDTPARYGASVWACTEFSGWASSISDDGWLVLDWGDCGDPADPYQIGGYQIGYACFNTVLPDRIACVTMFFGDDNGWDSSGRTYLAGFIVPNLPTADPCSPQAWNGWNVWIDLDPAGYDFTLSGSDMDADGLVDFSYTYWFWDIPAGQTGPSLAVADPNVLPPTAPGIEDVFDAFNDPNMIDGSYLGTYWFGGEIFAQFQMELFESNAVECNFPGASGNYCSADIDPTGPSYCVIDLQDLGVLLATYGLCPGDPGYAAVANLVDPNTPPDGCVGLADLGFLLAQYGDDCNVP
jgi:hypothetical protein